MSSSWCVCVAHHCRKTNPFWWTFFRISVANNAKGRRQRNVSISCPVGVQKQSFSFRRVALALAFCCLLILRSLHRLFLRTFLAMWKRRAPLTLEWNRRLSKTWLSAEATNICVRISRDFRMVLLLLPLFLVLLFFFFLFLTFKWNLDTKFGVQ